MEKLAIKVRGMTCGSCEKILEDAVSAVPGVDSVKASHSMGEVHVFSRGGVDKGKIRSAIEKAGYATGADRGFTAIALGLVAVLAALYFVLGNSGISFSPESDASFAALFLLGVFTGFHCIGMCGGFVLSYSLSGKNSIVHHLSYGGGRLLSYTLMGALFGLIGSAIAFTVEMRAAAAFFAGLFLMSYGMGMLGILPAPGFLRLKTPSFIDRISSGVRSRGPAAIGLLNGLMLACGPLQAMYIFAAAGGDALGGAGALFAFGLGTLPAMFVLGIAGSAASLDSLKKYMRYSGVLVVFLGLLMFSNGLALSGHPIVVPGGSPAGQEPAINGTHSEGGFAEIRMNVTRYGYEPNTFVLEKGVPVRWIINAVELNYCNNPIQVPEYGLEIKLEPGVQVIEFTPEDEGTFGWSCWMGMIRGSFVVVDGPPSGSGIDAELERTGDGAAAGPAPACGCGCSGGCGAETCGISQ